jgi:hypothetical protein
MSVMTVYDNIMMCLNKKSSIDGDIHSALKKFVSDLCGFVRTKPMMLLFLNSNPNTPSEN